MYALNQQHHAVLKFQFLSVHLADTRFKVIFGHLYSLAVHQFYDVVLQILVVYGLEVVKVVRAVGQLGCVKSVNEIVVRGERYGMQTARLKLYAETFAECRLSAAARTRNQHNPYGSLRMYPALYLLGNLHNLLFLQSLSHLNQVGSLASGALQINVSDISKSHYLVPFRCLRENLERLGLFKERSQLFGMVSVGHPQQQSSAVHRKAPHLHVSRARQQRVVIVVGGVTKGVIVHVHVVNTLKQLNLVVISQFGKQVYRLFLAHLVTAERHVLFHNAAHSLPYVLKLFLGKFRAVALVHRAEIAL